MPKESGQQVIARNKRARHDYNILDTYEAGIVLHGTEVKSLRAGRASLIDAFGMVEDGEIFLHALHIPEYAQGSWTNHMPRRTRKLLLHAKEIDKIAVKVKDGGVAIVPLELYFKDGRVKVEIALGKGKKEWDKRQDIAKRDADREIRREMGRRIKGM
ncbi:MAG: SsrA-binding protein SmpB [Cumulibacter sp.]|uniref:SsrA-binding protein SmpB n=1 Tax=Cumulibacter soli TaxID=2546344 RepID=UPI001067C147|nr:SsrA-binding protein SmpB [Cumulibacter soli]